MQIQTDVQNTRLNMPKNRAKVKETKSALLIISQTVFSGTRILYLMGLILSMGKVIEVR